MTKCDFSSIHCDTIGSFIFPADTAGEDSLRRLINAQKAAGLEIVTDGESGRRFRDKDFFWGLDGIERAVISEGRVYQPYDSMTELTRLTGRISYNENHPVFDRYRSASEAAGKDTPVKQTMPAPAQLLTELTADDTSWNRHYESIGNLIDDIAEAYRLTIRKLYDLGCRFIQFDDCSWEKLCDDRSLNTLIRGGKDVASTMENLLKANNSALDGRPEDLYVAGHICRSHHAGWRPTGDYRFVAPVLFARENVDAFYLEFNIDGKNDFSPLRHIPEGKRSCSAYCHHTQPKWKIPTK